MAEETVESVVEALDNGTIGTAEAARKIAGLVTRIEPILIFFIGLLVLILALGVFVPMWDMGQVQTRRGR